MRIPIVEGDRYVLLTADTMVEDEDNWRFAREVVAALSPRWEWIVLRDGRTPMQVGRDKRIVPNDRMAICSRILKREICRRWLDHNCDPADTMLYLGFDWTEEHRTTKAKPLWAPFEIACPLMDEPLLDKEQILGKFRSLGIEPPQLYAEGFSHANCGGACVRGGQASWALLLKRRPALYAEWEAEEEKTRQFLGKDVSILADRRKLPTESFDKDDWGACGCFDEAVEAVPVKLKRRPLTLRQFREEIEAGR
jgi:hypothetical protein